jgi:alanine-glyoxylate transaminase/serine-glyoxylate transaminase/serine-pyruvate transaminase
MSLPAAERLLFGPGPSLIAPRVMRAMAAPMLSHLDPDFMSMLDDIRGHLGRLFQAPPGSFAFAVSGTGTSGMEAAVANLVQPGTRATVVVTGYFGDRLAQMCERYGAAVTRVEVEWGRACDPERLRASLTRAGADIVAMVHAETSTGVLNPIAELADVARAHGAATVVDAVTSLGGHPLRLEAWQVSACYSCTQKCIGAPSGLAPIAFTPSALARRVASRSFYFDVGLLEDYWVRRKYHHTMSATLIYALREALLAIADEGLEARWARHERNHRIFAAGLHAMGLELLPPPAERLWTLNAVRVPAGVDEAAARKQLLHQFNMEIGAGLGPLAGRVWRIGLMGAGSSTQSIVLLLGALERVLAAQGHQVPAGAGTAAALAALDEVPSAAPA